MSLTLKELKTEVEAIYKPLTGKTFEGGIVETDTPAVSTGGPRDIVEVNDDDVCEIMQKIVTQVEKVSSRFEPNTRREKVWKGITLNPIPRLWVTPYEGDDDTTIFTVKEIEVVTGLNWQNSYKALVNITLE